MAHTTQTAFMHACVKVSISLFPLMFTLHIPSWAQDKDRSKIPVEFTWDLSHIYPTDDTWKEEKDRVVREIPTIEQYKGKLGSSAASLLGCMEKMSFIGRHLAKLYAYASMTSDQDTRASGALAMQQEIQQVYSDYGAKASFIEPEILKLDRATVDGFLAREKKLEPYRFYLSDILRRKDHTGTAAEEKIIADASLMASGPQDINGIFSNAEFPYPDATLSDGKTVKLDASGYSLHRTVTNREDRKVVMKTFFTKLNDFRRTFGTQLYAEVKKNMFYTRARKYSSALQASLDANNIPPEVYHALVTNVNDNLPTFHRYLGLRKRILGVDTLHYYDLYAPLLSDVELSYSVEEAERHILDALAPLGNDYLTVTRNAFNERWVDMFPTEGKRSGAYSNGSAYDVHPYMLMNYNGKYDDMSTLAHELGHTMQSYYSNRAQPWVTSNYSIFVAEVASTFNEALLIDHMLKQIKDDAVRLSLLGNYLEVIKGTVFRQTQFAEFELTIHERAEKGEALTGDVFNDIYRTITHKYYGHDKSVCVVDDEIQAEWAYIPHFYYNFYVYQYATSFTASAALSEKALSGDTAAMKRYLAFLASGGSDYPINQLRAAGVDMTTPEPFTLTMKKMNRVMDEIEAILTRMKRLEKRVIDE